MSASAAPAPDRAALLDCALACPVCSESFRRTHSLCCAQFTSGPFHREAHRSRQCKDCGGTSICEHNRQR